MLGSCLCEPLLILCCKQANPASFSPIQILLAFKAQTSHRVPRQPSVTSSPRPYTSQPPGYQTTLPLSSWGYDFPHPFTEIYRIHGWLLFFPLNNLSKYIPGIISENTFPFVINPMLDKRLMLNQCYIDAFHEKATLYNFSNTGQELDDVNITSKQMPWGLVMMQHRKYHCTEQ